MFSNFSKLCNTTSTIRRFYFLSSIPLKDVEITVITNAHCVEYGFKQDFDYLLDLDNKGILFLLGYRCLKLSSSIRSLVYHLILSSIWNRSDSPFVCGKEVQFFLVLDILANSSLLYKHSSATENQREREESVCEKKALSSFGYLIFVGCNLEQ